MKGLLIKDIRLILKNKRMVFIVFLVAAILLSTQRESGYGFFAGYVIMLCGMFALSTVTMDENDKSIAFLMTLPVGRDTYVKEKYILMSGCNFFGALLAVALCILLQPDQARETLLIVAVTFMVLLPMQLIMLPIELKYGSDRGRMVLMLFCALIAVIFALSKKIGYRITVYKASVNDASDWISLTAVINFISRLGKSLYSMGEWVIGIVCCFVLILCIMISFFISRGIMRKKEF